MPDGSLAKRGIIAGNMVHEMGGDLFHVCVPDKKIANSVEFEPSNRVKILMNIMNFNAINKHQFYHPFMINRCGRYRKSTLKMRNCHKINNQSHKKQHPIDP